MIEALIAILKGAWKWLWSLVRGVGEWLQKPHDWWRIGCIAGALVCAYLAIQLRGTEIRADAAEARVVTVTEEAKADVQAEQGRSELALTAERQVCATQKAEANAIAYRRISELERKNRELERQRDRAMAEIAATHRKETNDAKRAGDAVAAGLRDGSVVLRDEWGGQGAGSGGGDSMPGAAGGSAGTDEAAELRAAGAGDLVRLADQCDADIRAHQAVSRLDREVKP